jgi:NADH-quinone oxidoreductase subunit L
MFNLLFVVFLAPFLGFVVLSIGRNRFSESTAAAIGIGSMGIAALTTLALGIAFFAHPPAGGAFTQPLWQWLDVGGFAPRFALRLDGLSLSMLGVVTGVGFLIHIFAAWYMHEDDSCSCSSAGKGWACAATC